MELNVRDKYDTTLQAAGLVFSEKMYIVLAALISLVAVSFFVVANNIATFTTAVSASHTYSILPLVFWSQVTALAYASGALNFSATLVVALLSGLTISMIVYKFNNTHTAKGKGGFYGFLGVFAGALGASCPACSIALISLLGVSSAAFLPFHGLELSLLAIGLLVFSLYMISKSLVDCEECKVKL